MRAFRADHFSLLLSNNEKLALGLQPYLQEISCNNIETTFGAMIELAKAIKQHFDPIRKINALVAVLRLMQEGTYPALLFAEIYILPPLTKVVEYLLDNRDFQSVASFFERTGLPANTPHIQNLSYNFVALSCQVIQMGSIIKPFRVYQGQQYEEPSLFTRWHEKILKEKVNNVFGNGQKRSDWERVRQLYSLSLGKWNEFSDSIVYFFMEMLDNYLANENNQKTSPLFDILQYGESIITEETIARLIDILAYHLSFDVRVKALKLFDRMILWGDVEALLVINFTENIENIIKAFWQVHGEKSIEEGRHIYPQINGQQIKKQQFYRFFLMAFQCWAVTFPNHQFLVPSSGNTTEISPIYHLYKLLRQKKKTIFPINPNLGRYETEARMAMLEKTYRNRLILKEINNQSQLSSVSIVIQHKLNDVQQYYETHKEILVNLISKKVDPYEAMQKLAQFQLHFQEMVQSLSLDDDPGATLDKLIQNGLELIQIITLIHSPFLQLLHNELTEKQFFDRIMNQCVNYFTPSQEKQLIAFYSQKVAHKKQSLVEMLRLQKSDPLQKDLKFITNSIMVKQFRHKYRQKLEKMSSSKNSEQSQINLQIFTKTKFTRESREQMERSFRFDKKQSFKETLSPNKDLLKVKNSEISAVNSLKSSRQKKKLTLASRQLQNRKKDANYGQNQNQFIIQVNLLKMNKLQVTSQTRSSRDRQSQKSCRITDHQVSLHENSQYFTFMPNQHYKFSYICHNLLIFKSPFITIERSISRDDEYPNRVKIQIHLTTHKFIPDFQFLIEDQECIKMEYQPQTLPLNLENNCKFKIFIYGQMKKIPLRLPTIAMFIRKKMFFEYILPFTFNFFLKENAKKSANQQYHQLKIQAKHRYFTQNLILSKILFPNQTLIHLPYIFPGCALEQQHPREIERYLWLASYSNLTFLFVFQLNPNNRHLQIRGFDANRSDNYNSSMLKYAVNLFAHMLSERQA